MPNLRVCFVAGTLGRGGAERQLYYMLRVLRDRGADPVVLALTSGEFWEERIRALNVPVVWVGRWKSQLLRLCAIAKAVRRLKPHVIQSQHSYTNPYATAVGLGLSIPVIAAIRNDFISEIQGEGAAARRWGYRYAGIVAANSRAALNTARSTGIPRGRLMLLPNVVDTAEFACPLRTLRTPVRLLTVGRLVRQKRHDRFLRALAALRMATTTPFTATVLGGGAERKNLEKLAKKLGLLNGIVRFAEPSAQMRQYYEDADLLVLTSDHEGTPNVVLEAMAAGLPVVSTKVGDMGNIVHDGISGFLVSAEDDDALLDRLVKLVDSERLRSEVGQQARRRIEEGFSVDSLGAHLSTLYEMALA